jgi:NADH:ubiquinone oxidoreductase subunit 6 (subunit J)
MSIAFAVIALTTLVAAAVAMALRNLIHSALLLIAAWAGIAAFYLWSGAEFVSFAQILVYVGAISMVVLFAVLLTRRSRDDLAADLPSLQRGLGALLVGGAVFGILLGAVAGTPLATSSQAGPSITARQLGLELAGPHAAALLIAGLVLTVSLLGAIVIAAQDVRGGKEDAP